MSGTSFDLMESRPIPRATPMISGMPGISINTHESPLKKSPNIPIPSSSRAPHVCETLSSPLSPLMLQPDYVSESVDYEHEHEMERNNITDNPSFDSLEFSDDKIDEIVETSKLVLKVRKDNKQKETDNQKLKEINSVHKINDVRRLSNLNFYIKPDIIGYKDSRKAPKINHETEKTVIKLYNDDENSDNDDLDNNNNTGMDTSNDMNNESFDVNINKTKNSSFSRNKNHRKSTTNNNSSSTSHSSVNSDNDNNNHHSYNNNTHKDKTKKNTSYIRNLDMDEEEEEEEENSDKLHSIPIYKNSTSNTKVAFSNKKTSGNLSLIRITDYQAFQMKEIPSDDLTPSHSSLTCMNPTPSTSHTPSSSLRNFRIAPVDQEQDDQLPDPLTWKPSDYAPPNIGTAFQCQNLPQVLNPTQRIVEEQRNKVLEPTLVYHPPPNAEHIYQSERL